MWGLPHVSGVMSCRETVHPLTDAVLLDPHGRTLVPLPTASSEQLALIMPTRYVKAASVICAEFDGCRSQGIDRKQLEDQIAAHAHGDVGMLLLIRKLLLTEPRSAGKPYREKVYLISDDSLEWCCEQIRNRRAV